ncbi:hypothetical protein [Pedobacter gandavensis]|uniref:hypothetical protein n=1 Tax=Pedobacter gandavensis TaxID=2679963 RepID=UPI00292F4C07|nr:hypothetical protein [Pedobacter gandavensis]
MNINIQDKNTGDSHSAGEFNLFKQAINSKADRTELEAETDARLQTELIFEAGFQTKVNKTDYAVDKQAFIDEDFRLNQLIQNLTGVDLTDYFTKTESDTKYQVKGDYLTVVDWSMISNKPVIPSLTGYSTEAWVEDKGYLTSVSWNIIADKPQLFSGAYSDLIGLPTIPSLSGYATEEWISNKGFITGFTQNFDYSSLINKPTLFSGVYSDLSGKPSLVDAYSKIESDSKYLSTGTTIFNGDYNSLINKPSIPSLTGYATEAWVTGKGYISGVTFANIQSKPTTVAGYGITDAVSTTTLNTAVALKADLSLSISSKTANYTLVLADNGKMITMNMAGANTLTIPTNATVALPIGSQIIVYAEGVGVTTITPASGVTINSVGGKTKITGQYSTVTLIKKATNIWAVIGDLS